MTNHLRQGYRSDFHFRGLRFLTPLSVFLFILVVHTLSSSSKADTVDLQAVEAYVNKTFSDDKVPGGAVAIVQDGEIVFLKGFGSGNEGRKTTETSSFLLGSMSKSLTALAVMRLVEEGMVSLDAPVLPLLPELEDTENKDWSKVTLRQLLNHTSGLPVRTPGPKAGAPLPEYVKALSEVSMAHTPGSRHLYSSANYLLAARVLETVTGKPFSDILMEQVFLPLEFQSARNTDVPVIGGHRYWYLWPVPTQLPKDPGRLSTAAASANILDMARFLQFQLGDGTWKGTRLLSAKGLSQMQTGSADGDGFKYGFGWRDSVLAGVRIVHHGGILPNYRGKMVLLPDQKTGVVVLTNASSVVPFPLHPTSHSLANDIALHLAGGPLGFPGFGYMGWLMIYWAGLGLILLHQLLSVFRAAVSRDITSHPMRAAAIDLVFVGGLIVAVPWFIGLGWQDIASQTPDLTLWIVAMAVLGCMSAFFHLAKHRSTTKQRTPQ